MEDTARSAGIVLCGGQSQRMGRPKADLVFGDETLLQRIVRTLLEVVERVVVVHAAEQGLPAFDDRVTAVADRVAFAGPLVGLQVGLETLEAQEYDRVYLTGCDAPFLSPVFVRTMLNYVGKYDVAIPVDDEFFFPLAAAYQTRVLPQVQELVQRGERRPRMLLDACRTLRIPTHTLTSVDLQLRSLVNVNTPRDYRAALQAHALPEPDWLKDVET